MHVEWKYIPKIGEIVYSEKTNKRYVVFPTIGTGEGYTLWEIVGYGYELRYEASDISINDLFDNWSGIVNNLGLVVVHGLTKVRLFGDKFV